jgi:hypothetical protein
LLLASRPNIKEAVSRYRKIINLQMSRTPGTYKNKFLHADPISTFLLGM